MYTIIRADGWETPHSREADRNDYVVIQLASPGTLNFLGISTEHYLGKFFYKDSFLWSKKEKGKKRKKKEKKNLSANLKKICIYFCLIGNAPKAISIDGCYSVEVKNYYYSYSY